MAEEHILSPCPFCNADVNECFAGLTERAFARGPDGSFAVDCNMPDGRARCGCMGPFKATMQEAIEAWNHRPSSAEIRNAALDEAAKVARSKDNMQCGPFTREATEAIEQAILFLKSKETEK